MAPSMAPTVLQAHTAPSDRSRRIIAVGRCRPWSTHIHAWMRAKRSAVDFDFLLIFRGGRTRKLSEVGRVGSRVSAAWMPRPSPMGEGALLAKHCFASARTPAASGWAGPRSGVYGVPANPPRPAKRGLGLCDQPTPPRGAQPLAFAFASRAACCSTRVVPRCRAGRPARPSPVQWLRRARTPPVRARPTHAAMPWRRIRAGQYRAARPAPSAAANPVPTP